jgi:exopolyphosphatase / guanosine-5'-triphosphate,3'-diphosphate pyrophosphatase
MRLLERGSLLISRWQRVRFERCLMSVTPQYASVDLGSNSFHLVMARIVDDELVILDKLKERVRLASGLNSENYLDESVQEQALKCLDRFGHRLAHLARGKVRVVGTNTLRKAKNAESFIQKAEAVLGHEIEIISGLEEARLIYKGVAQFLPSSEDRRLVIDIGGGSTECIIGRDLDILQADSFYMGCVEFTKHFFPRNSWSQKDFQAAVNAARLQIGPIQRKYKDLGWGHVFGSSGTINAVGEVLQANQFGSTITRSGIDWLFGYIQGARSAEALKLEGLKQDRVPVFVGGVCILWALFHGLKIKSMTPVSTALREGVLSELAGMAEFGDVREHSVARLVRRFAADVEHATLVKSVLKTIGPQFLSIWEMDTDVSLKLLDWAAELHEIGKSIQYSGYHKHSAYLVSNSHLAGFSRQDQNALSAMLLCHRRKLERGRVSEYVGQRTEEIVRLTVILRLAVLLCRTRSQRTRPNVGVSIDGAQLTLSFPKGYLDERPLTEADLAQEASYLKVAGIELRIGHD